MNTYYNPVHTCQGAGCLAQLPRLAQDAAPETAHVLVLVCMETLRQNHVVQELEAKLHGRITTICFPHSNPTLEQLFDVYAKTEGLGVGLVIAIGGGSTLDVGKSLCCLYGREILSAVQLRGLIKNKQYGSPVCRWIGVPTTAGTGSEVTCWATVWDPQDNVKYSIDTPDNYAYAALADPELLYSMPVGLAVSSALDAVCHAAESYWANAANPASQALALAAIRMVMGNIDGLFQTPHHTDVHDAMSQGSMLAGLAFSNTRTTACHSISYPLTMQYHLPHGVAVSLLLAPVLELNQDAIPALEPLLYAFGVTSPEALRGRISRLLTRAGFPVPLREWGAQETDIPMLAAHGITKGRADNNPVELTEPTVIHILKTIF